MMAGSIIESEFSADPLPAKQGITSGHSQLMMARIGRAVLLVLLFVACVNANNWVTASVVDDFSTLQTDLVGERLEYNSANGNMLGGNRDMILTGNGQGSGTSEGVDEDSWSVYGHGGNGTFSLQYDGSEATNVLATNGLGSVDLTVNGGIAFQLAIAVGIDEGQGASFIVTVYTNNGTQTCTWEQQLPQTNVVYLIEFQDLPTCDFTQVGAVEIIITYPSISARVSNFRVVADPNAPPSPTPSPTPSPSRSPGSPLVLTLGLEEAVSVSPSATAMFQTSQLDSSSFSSITFTCATPSSVSAPHSHTTHYAKKHTLRTH